MMYRFTELLLEAERQALLSGETVEDMFTVLTSTGVRSECLFDSEEEE